ncbi:MAG: hypothetical protein DHS20C18_34900 [Saprospiraceae bacterium]|nr:MAG: hypothetical protein DHS20C18_34900 [Saprospiraceae bacterium]
MTTQILIPLLTALFTGIIGFILGDQRARLDYRQALATQVWQERNRLYQELLKLMQILPLYPSQVGEVTYQELLEGSKQFQDWYFQGGGLYLANKTRQTYLNMQKQINHCIQNQKAKQLELAVPLSEEDYNKLQKLMSLLRMELATDLLSRKRTIMSS